MPQLTSALQRHCSFQWQSNRNYFNARGQPSAPNTGLFKQETQKHGRAIQRCSAQVSSSGKDLVNTALGQEVPKATSRDLLHHPEKFQHFIAGEYLPIGVFDKLTYHVNTSSSCVWLVGNAAACDSGLPLPSLSLDRQNVVRNIALEHKQAAGLHNSDCIAEHRTANRTGQNTPLSQREDSGKEKT